MVYFTIKYKKRPLLSKYYITGGVLIGFTRGYLLIIVPKGFLTKDSDNHFGD